MKTILLSILCLSFVTAYSQTIFESEADVLQYLTTKSPFTNKEANVSLTFSDMGSRLSSGRSSYFNPDVTLVSSTRAVVEYQSLNNPDVTVQFIVDTKENVIMDRRDRSIFRAYSYDEEQPQKTPVKQPVKPAPKKKPVPVKKKS